MVVVAIMATATLGVALALPDPGRANLEKEAARLASLLDTARAYSRASGIPVIWQATDTGFQFEGLSTASAELFQRESHWLTATVRTSTQHVVLGPEPIIAPQTVVLELGQLRVALHTDGLQPFTVRNHQPSGPVP